MIMIVYYIKCFLCYVFNIRSVNYCIKVYFFEIDVLKFCDKVEIVK